MKRLGLGAIVLLLLLGLAWALWYPGTATLSAEETDLCEAAFRHSFTHSGSGLDTLPTFFLSVGAKDPPDDFLARFAGHSPPVRPGSRYAPGAGMLFSVKAVRRVGDGRVQVLTGDYMSIRCTEWRCYFISSCSSSSVYTLARKGGRWVVVEDWNLSVSCG